MSVKKYTTVTAQARNVFYLKKLLSNMNYYCQKADGVILTVLIEYIVLINI